MAETATTDRERRSWLDLAEAWLRMLSVPRDVRSADEDFEADVYARGTNQLRSKARN